MGWFPGYAVDVETGERLNLFFGENTVYRDFVAEALGLGTEAHDMVWNPGAQIVLPTTGIPGPLELYVGGQHYIYVTREKYDGCAEIRKNIDRTSAPLKARALGKMIRPLHCYLSTMVLFRMTRSSSCGLTTLTSLLQVMVSITAILLIESNCVESLQRN